MKDPEPQPGLTESQRLRAAIIVRHGGMIVARARTLLLMDYLRPWEEAARPMIVPIA